MAQYTRKIKAISELLINARTQYLSQDIDMSNPDA